MVCNYHTINIGISKHLEKMWGGSFNMMLTCLSMNSCCNKNMVLHNFTTTLPYSIVVNMNKHLHPDYFSLLLPIHLLNIFRQPLNPELVSDISLAFRPVVRVV